MATFRELVYLCLDEIKGISDDFSFTEDHVIFLLNKYRSFILKQRYSDIKKQIPESNYQTICLNLDIASVVQGSPCAGVYLKSTNKIPFLMQIGTPRVYPIDYFKGEIAYVSRDRMKYVGHNKYLKNIIYSSLGPDNYLYFKSSNPQHYYLKKVRFTGIFQDAAEASELLCDNDSNNNCDILDREFPLENALIPVVIELVVKELGMATYNPNDIDNNANDDLAGLTVKQ